MAPEDEILEALDAELMESQKPERFTVEAVQQERAVWKVWLSPVQYGGRLDESLEGAYAWWLVGKDGPRATADVLSVVPEEEFVILRFLTGPLPAIGKELRIYPIQYLQKIRDLWSSAEFAEKSLNWWNSFVRDNIQIPQRAADPSPFPWLRQRQRDAFSLPAWKTSFLWGPPGTGKTTTLGALLASTLWRSPSTRILLLSTTNSAVDQAIVAVDNALAKVTASQPQPSPLRKSCLRIGSHFIPRYYEGREHLLPMKDLTLLQRLLELHKNEPAKGEAQRYARWKAEVEGIQNEMWKQAADALRRARLAAMTTTGAAFRYDDLRQLTPYDLVVFDEASQVSIVHALSLVGLGKHILFAGDPRQLAPVVKSDHPDAREWLRKSPFERMPERASCTCFLDEQSRMADSICALVSHTFYGGRLKVAADKRRDPKWLSEREPFHIQGHGRRNAYLVPTDAEAKYSQSMGGWIRYETAEQIVKFVDRLMDRLQQDDILVITPYRAQRTLIRQKLRNAGYKRVQVSTVHRAQGSERDTVIFDVVAADNSFLNNEDLGPRLINVAVSRAKARIILFASPENRRNRFISQIAAIIENSDNLRRVESIDQFIKRTDFPNCIVGKTVAIPRKNGTVLVVRVTGLDPSGTKLTAVNCYTGAPTSLSIEHLRNTAGRRN